MAAAVTTALVAVTVTVPPPDAGGPATADRATVARLLSGVPTVARRVHVLGYDRALFGDWAPAVTGTGRGCTTRDLVMFRTFGTPAAPATHVGGPVTGCPDASGSATDVYTGAPVTPPEVQVDHIVPLAAAWDHGAHAWPPGTRKAFANDVPLNLVAVSAGANQAKSDGTPAEWLPDREGPTPCAYVARYLTVISTYALSISVADARAARTACRM